MRSRFSIVVMSVLGLASAQALPAQGRDRGLVELPARPVRSGLYITGGLMDGMEQYRYSGYTDYSDQLSSPAAVLRIGGTPNQSVRLGGELYGWWHTYYDADPTVLENATEYFTTAMLAVQVYPAARSGFYLKGGAGFAHSGTSYEFDEGASGNAFGFTAGAGFDLRLSRGVSIAPTIDYYQAKFNHPADATGPNTYTERVLNIGASLTFQFGNRWR